MGNISSPVITRLGIKQLWYKHWYTDRLYFFRRSVSTDSLLETLLTLYLSYGLVRTKNIFKNDYWHKNYVSYHTRKINTRKISWFRRFFFKKASVNFEYSYIKRGHSGEYFPFKLWLMRFKGWFVMIVNWFKPIKVRVKRRRYRNQRLVTPNSSYIFDFSKNRNLVRLKILVFMCKKLLNCRVYQYSF